MPLSPHSWSCPWYLSGPPTRRSSHRLRRMCRQHRPLLSSPRRRPTGTTATSRRGTIRMFNSALEAGGRSFRHHSADDVVCRQYAQQQIGVAPRDASMQSNINAAALGTALGAATGAAIGAATGHPGIGAAVGAGGGLLAGTARGAQAGATFSEALQERYNIAYIQCMYAKGDQVPGVAAAPAPSAARLPPPPWAPPPGQPHR
jgi:hypothetical protein